MRLFRRLELAGELDTATLVRWLFIVVWAASAANALHYLNRGWFPHDLGTLAQPAARVLRGQWPHRDFEDVYTGGLALLDAVGFRVLGVSAMALRWVVFAVYLAWVPAVWYLARRFSGPLLAAAATLLAAAWTLPMYAEGMPSWYNLFLATFGAAALFHWMDVRRRRWLFAAGLAGGLSVLVKIVGLYYVAGVSLYLAYEAASSPAGAGRGESRSARAFSGAAMAAAVLLAGLIAALVVRAMRVEGLLRFGVPALAPPLALAAWIAWRGRGRTSGAWRRLASTLGPFLAGVLLPVAAYVAPYAAVGALGLLYRGVFVLPARRLASARWEGVWGHGLGAALAVCAVLWVARPPKRRDGVGLLLTGGVVVLLVGALVASFRNGVYLPLWQALWWLPPAVAVACAVRVLTTKEPTDRDRKLFALFSIYGLASLVEIPFAAPIYFFFSAPLLVVLALALAGDGPPRRGGWLLVGVVFLLGFTGLRLDPGFIRNLGLRAARDVQDRPLVLPRSGGLHVDAEDARDYESVVGLVDALASGPWIYATPDCPEVYFLSGKWNPTRTLYEFLDPAENTPSRILETLDRVGVRVVVINRDPLFSRPVSPELVSGLQKRYPLARSVGRFLVVWKPSPNSASGGPASP